MLAQRDHLARAAANALGRIADPSAIPALIAAILTRESSDDAVTAILEISDAASVLPDILEGARKIGRYSFHSRNRLARTLASFGEPALPILRSEFEALGAEPGHEILRDQLSKAIVRIREHPKR